MATSFQNRKTVSENVINEDINKRITNIRFDEINSDTSNINFSVGLYDIDTAFGTFLTNTVKPTVNDGVNIINVPVMYASPEKWKSARTLGYYRDEKSKIILPLIMYRRTNVTKNDGINFPRIDQLYYSSKTKWSMKNAYNGWNNIYDNSGLLVYNENLPTDMMITSLPNYVTINYDISIWTSFIEQTNLLIEKLLFTNSMYWGDDNRFKFRVEISSFDTTVDVSADTERAVKVNSSVTLNGYLLPPDFNSQLTSKKILTPTKIIISSEKIIE